MNTPGRQILEVILRSQPNENYRVGGLFGAIGCLGQFIVVILNIVCTFLFLMAMALFLGGVMLIMGL